VNDTSWTRTTDPTELVVSVDDVRAGQARLTHTDEDQLWRSFLETAIDAAEEYLGRGLLTQTYTLWVEDWASEIPLPMAAPLQSVDSVHYYNAGGTLTALSSSYYIEDASREPAQWLRAPSTTLPALQADRRGGRVRIVYTVGWASPQLVPERIRQGIRIYATGLDDARNGVDIDFKTVERVAQTCWGARVFVPPVECA